MKAVVTIEIEPPIPCTDDEFKEWVLFNLHYTGSMAVYPLGEYEFDTDRMKIISFKIQN